MYFETWLDKKKFQTSDKTNQDESENQEPWLAKVRAMNGKDLRSYLDLVTLSCMLLASKVNEQN